MSQGMQRRRRRGRGMGSSAVRGAATIALAALANDMRNPEGLVRPLLRGAADRLRLSGFPVFGQIGRGYLRLDRPPVQVLEPLAARQRRGVPSLPSGLLDVRDPDGGTASGHVGRSDDRTREPQVVENAPYAWPADPPELTAR